MNTLQETLAAARAYLKQKEIDRQMRRNAPKGHSPRKIAVKHVTCEGVGSSRSGKAFEFFPMLVSKARRLDYGDGVSVLVAGQRRVGVVCATPKIIGKTISLTISYQSTFYRRPTMAVGEFTGYQAPGARMKLVLQPEGRLDF